MLEWLCPCLGMLGVQGGSLCWGNVALHPPPLLSPLPRHLFAIANVAYSKVMDAKHNQCIIIRWDMAVPTHGSPGIAPNQRCPNCRLQDAAASLARPQGRWVPLGMGCWVGLG